MADWRRDIERALSGMPVRLRPDEPLSRHTSFGIGGPARLWLEVGSEPALAASLRFCHDRGIRWRVLGWGSNVLISDQGLDGVVFSLVGEFAGLTVAGDRVESGAGAALDHIADAAEAAGLPGFAFLAGIPGTLGGGMRTNAGAFGRSLSDLLEEVRVMEPDGSVRVLAGPELGRGYREPVYRGQGVVVAARLRSNGHQPAGEDFGACGSCAEIRARRRGKQPVGNSAGSFFRNPPGAAAGRLIEQCGLKGRRVGAAQVSEKHANFILNTGGARFADVYELAQVVKANVEARTGILLEEEVQVLPEEDNETVVQPPQ